MKIIRWWGLGVFIAVVGTFVLLYVVFADWLIERGIEKAGSAMLGAKVELDSVHLALFDGQLVLHRLQVTNAREPMRNLFEVAEIKADIDMRQAFWKRVHIDEMAINGLRFDTARSASGFIAEEPEKDSTSIMPQLTEFDWAALTDSKGAAAALNDLKLDSLKSVDDLRAQLKSAEADIKTRIAALPTAEQIKQYQERARVLGEKPKGNKLEQAMAYVQKAKEIEKLRADLKADGDKVKALKSQYEQSRAQLKAQYEKVKSAPDKDLQRALDQFSFELPGSDRLISQLLGPELNGNLNQGRSWYEAAQPWIEKARLVAGKDPNAPPPPKRFAGVTVHFPESDPQPDIWLKRAHIDGAIDWHGWSGDFAGTLSDVSDEPALIAQPTKLDLAGKAKAGGSMQFVATLDQRQLPGTQSAHLQMDNVAFSELSLSKSPALTIAAQRGQLTGYFDASHEADKMKLQSSLQFHHLQLQLGSNNDQTFVQDLLQELQKTEQFDVRLLWLRDANDETRELSSSLDGIARQATKRVIAKTLETKKAEVKAKLQERIKAELASLEQSWGAMSALEPLLSGKALDMDALLKKATSLK